jgi:methionyl-tRNA formyltransferase
MYFSLSFFMIRIGFFGTPELAANVLQDLLLDVRFDVVFAVTNPDKPIGRSAVLTPTPVKVLARNHGLPVYTPHRIRENYDLFAMLETYSCDYFVVVAYGKILPQAVLDIPKKLCINVHGSILPKYRWASPIQSALLHWETQTGVTIMSMSLGMDEWDTLFVEPIDIDLVDTSLTLFEKFAQISWDTLIRAILWYESWHLSLAPQDHAQATYCKKIEKEDGIISWNQSAQAIYHMWQAYTPWPGIYTTFAGKRLILEWVRAWVPDGPLPEWSPWSVIQMDTWEVGILCREGILLVHQVKLEGKKSQHIRDFLHGNQSFISSILPS